MIEIITIASDAKGIPRTCFSRTHPRIRVSLRNPRIQLFRKRTELSVKNVPMTSFLFYLELFCHLVNSWVERLHVLSTKIGINQVEANLEGAHSNARNFRPLSAKLGDVRRRRFMPTVCPTISPSQVERVKLVWDRRRTDHSPPQTRC